MMEGERVTMEQGHTGHLGSWTVVGCWSGPGVGHLHPVILSALPHNIVPLTPQLMHIPDNHNMLCRRVPSVILYRHKLFD